MRRRSSNCADLGAPVATGDRRLGRALAFAGFLGAFLALSPSHMDVRTAHAGQRASTFTVATRVGAGCSVVVQNMTFPTYLSGQATIDNGTSGFEIDCSSATPGNPVPITYTVTAPGGFIMKRGASNLNYRLCFDSGCTQVIPNGSGTAVLVDRAIYALPYYGQIFANQADPVGAYSQTVNVTVTY